MPSACARIAVKKIAEFLSQATLQRLVLIWMCGLTTWVTVWCTGFVSTHPGVESAAVIAAIMGPITALQGAIFGWTK